MLISHTEANHDNRFRGPRPFDERCRLLTHVTVEKLIVKRLGDIVHVPQHKTTVTTLCAVIISKGQKNFVWDTFVFLSVLFYTVQRPQHKCIDTHERAHVIAHVTRNGHGAVSN